VSGRTAQRRGILDADESAFFRAVKFTFSGPGRGDARLMAELQNPAVRRLFQQRMAGEVGGQGAAAQQAFAETVMNRAAARHQSLQQTLVGSYWGSRLQRTSAAQAAEYDRLIAAARRGSNLANFGTGNWSGRRGRGFGRGGYGTATIGGEQFGVEAADRAWARNLSNSLNRRPVSSTVNAPVTNSVTINNATPEQANAQARAVQRAMQDPIRQMLATLKQAQNREARLAYA
jgi:hypothetical protein